VIELSNVWKWMFISVPLVNVIGLVSVPIAKAYGISGILGAGTGCIVAVVMLWLAFTAIETLRPTTKPAGK